MGQHRQREKALKASEFKTYVITRASVPFQRGCSSLQAGGPAQQAQGGHLVEMRIKLLCKICVFWEATEVEQPVDGRKHCFGQEEPTTAPGEDETAGLLWVPSIHPPPK